MKHRRATQQREAAGVDITANVNLRMVRPEYRAIQADGDGLPSDEVVLAISNRLPASLRDEAIWQYHVCGHRGVVLWTRNHKFRYLGGAHLDGNSALRALTTGEIRALLAAYEPTKEALLVSEYPDGIELLQIDEQGVVTRIEGKTLT